MKPTGTSAKRKADEVHAPVDAPVQVNRPGEEIWPIERIRAHVRNARKHPKKQIDDLRASFRKYGQVHTLLVREDGTLIAGHGRLEAMKHEGFSHVAVIVARGWTEARCRAFALLDNKIALNSEWGDDLLASEWKDRALLDEDVKALGFDGKELDKLVPPPPSSNANESKAPAGATLKPLVQFNIVFDDEVQQQQWFAFVKRLKIQYPDDETLGQRLAKHIEALPNAPG
jgi:hypothetical protein